MIVAASLYNWPLFAHVLAAMVWLGGGTVTAALATRALRSNEPDEVGRFVGNLRVIGPLLLAPPPAILLGAGIWMVLKSWHFSDGWIAFGISLFAAAFLIGALYQSRAALAAERAAGDAEAARRYLRRWSWGVRVILILLVIATWDMVLKPGL